MNRLPGVVKPPAGQSTKSFTSSEEGLLLLGRLRGELRAGLDGLVASRLQGRIDHSAGLLEGLLSRIESREASVQRLHRRSVSRSIRSRSTGRHIHDADGGIQGGHTELLGRLHSTESLGGLVGAGGRAGVRGVDMRFVQVGLGTGSGGQGVGENGESSRDVLGHNRLAFQVDGKH